MPDTKWFERQGCEGVRGKFKGSPERQFWFRLTLALGHPSVAACQQAISSREYVEWRAYNKISPLGPERLDHLMAMFMWLFASANRRKKGKKFKIQDFLPAWGRPNNQKTSQRRQWSSKEIWDFMVGVAAGMPDE